MNLLFCTKCNSFRKNYSETLFPSFEVPIGMNKDECDGHFVFPHPNLYTSSNKSTERIKQRPPFELLKSRVWSLIQVDT